MIAAAGMWVLIMGFACVYTGVSWFMNSSTAPSLAQSLGLASTTAQTASYQPSTGTPAASTQLLAAGSTGSTTSE